MVQELFYQLSLGFCGVAFMYLVLRHLHHSGLRVKDKRPGPKAWPYLGNVFDMPRAEEWKVFHQWTGKYGDVVFVDVMGHRMVILGSIKAVNELLVERSSIYSDRARFPLVDLIGHQFNFGFMSYGKRWQACRRTFASGYGKNKLRAYYDTHLEYTMNLLQSLSKEPKNYVEHLRLHAAQTMLDITYGIQVTSNEDPLVKTAERVMRAISIAVSPAAWVFNPIPLIQCLPSWLGGNNFARLLSKWQDDLLNLRNVPFEQAKSMTAAGGAKPNFTATLLSELSNTGDPDQEELIQDCAAVAFGGGVDTTVSAATTFMLAMVTNPDVQARAQEEIDRIIGSDRLPDFSDREALPYITAVMKETFRWHPPAPQGIPHLLVEDDNYRGHFIPKGTIVIGSIWGILHDATLYNDPFAFRPDRFITEGKLDITNDPARIAFGFGRRICPGIHFAEDTLWLMMAQILAAYDLTTNGCEKPPIQFTSGAISHPKAFRCNFRFRSEKARTLVTGTE